MIEAGSRVAARSNLEERGTVVRREFDALARGWLYDVDWDSGGSTRVPFLELVEETCA